MKRGARQALATHYARPSAKTGPGRRWKGRLVFVSVRSCQRGAGATDRQQLDPTLAPLRLAVEPLSLNGAPGISSLHGFTQPLPQLSKHRKLAAVLECGADRGRFSLGDDEHRRGMPTGCGAAKCPIVS